MFSKNNKLVLNSRILQRNSQKLPTDGPSFLCNEKNERMLTNVCQMEVQSFC